MKTQNSLRTDSMSQSTYSNSSQIVLQAAGLKDFVSYQKKKHILLSDIISQSLKCSLTSANAAMTKQEYLCNNEWFNNRQQELCDHRKLVNGVFEAIDRKLALSSTSWSTLYQFFSDRNKHERAMCQDVISNKKLTLIYKDSENLHHQIYPTFQRAFTEFDQMLVKQAQQVMEFCQFVEIGIMKDVLIKSKELWQKGLKGIREQIIQDKEKIAKSYTKMNERFEKYLGNYEAIYTGKRPSTPIYNEQMEFLETAKKLLQLQNQFGLHVLQYWNESFEKESNKLQAISEALRLYITKYEEIFGKTKLTEYPVQLVNELKPIDDCRQFFSIEETLNADCMNIIYKYAESQALDMDELKKYMSQYNFQSELERPNFLQIFPIQRNRGTLSKSYKNCYAIITSDQYLLLSDEQIDPVSNKFCNKCKNFYRLEYIVFKPKNNTNEVEVQEKAPGLFSSSKSKWLMFENSGKLEEIKQYISSILQ